MKAILDLWIRLTPWTKRTIIIVVGVVMITLIICAAVTGNFDLLLNLIGGGDNE